jgi:hypothetical protein
MPMASLVAGWLCGLSPFPQTQTAHADRERIPQDD